MLQSLSQLLRRWRYGEEIVVVSGLPRSGTSMMMKMLEAGGLAILTDGLRAADEDNPRGYYEFERVKRLDEEPDKAWVSEARGKVLKVISHLLKELPEEHFYRVVFMRRDLQEVVVSQNKMLTRRGEANPIEDERAVELFRKHLIHVKMLVEDRPNFALLEVDYRAALDDALACAERVNAFLRLRLDADRMASAVDSSLYRSRRERIAGA